MRQHDFLMEKRLRELDPALHRRFTDTVFALQHTLSHFRRLFPAYTDHSELHSLTVIDFCNALIGGDQVEKLNADEIYVLLMSCYLHDIGMGISESDYEIFKQKFHADAYFAAHPEGTAADLVRKYHHEFSALFICKYAELLEIPSPEHLFCIAQVSRGHRQTDLMDENEYPAAYPLPGGNTVCLPYLAALIRLADEIDVAADRNTLLKYDSEAFVSEYQQMCDRILEAVKRLHIEPEGFTMDVCTDDADTFAGVCQTRDKMQETLDLCRRATHDRTPFCIRQEWVRINRL